MPTSVGCPDERALQEYLLGRTSEYEARDLEGHVSACSACALKLNSLAERDSLAQPLPHVLHVHEVGGEIEALIGRLCERADTPQATDAPIADVLGDFRILHEIGRGGMGVVYVAQQISLGRKVALKVLPFAAALDQKQLQRFKNEAQAAAQLHHTNIVPVHYVGCERGVHFYAMQFIDGQSLAAVLDELRRLAGRKGRADETTVSQVARDFLSGRTPLAEASPEPGHLAACTSRLQDNEKVEDVPVADTAPGSWISTQQSFPSPAYFRAVARLCVQAAQALEHAHQVGVVHRDVKPANLLVDVRGNLWITDFGLAHFQGRAGLTMTGDLLGTLHYMSPEQALAKRVPIDHRTDVYSLGATLYELVTLQPVFAGSERQELLRQIAFEEPRSPRRHQRAVPRELETIVLKALQKNPAQRYRTAQEMGDDLERFLKDEPIRARRPNLVQRTRKWMQRHKAATGAMACVAAVCLVVVGAFGYERGQRSQHVEDCLLRARTWMAKNELAKTRQELAEARSWIGTYGPLLRKRAAEVENFGADVDNFESFLRLVDQAHDMEFPPPLVVAVQGDRAGQAGSLPQQTKFDRDPGSVVPFLLRALSCYEVLERDDWSTRLEDGLLQPDQVARVRRTVYEELMWLANDLVERGADHRSGQKLSPQQRAPRALTYLQQAEAAPPLTAAFFRIRAACHKALGHEAQSRKDAELARQTPASIALDHYLLGVAAFDAGKKAEAVQHFEAALRVEPGHYWSLFWLGHSVAALGQSEHDYAAAVAAFSGCLLKRPDHAYAYCSRGNAYAELNRLTEAVSEYRKALQLRPDDPFAHANMGEALRRQGKLVEAEAEMREGLRLRPDMHEVHSSLGTALGEQGRVAEAVAEFHEALRRRPGYSRAILNLAITHYNYGNNLADQGKMAEAEVQYRKALQVKPDYADAHCNLGNALREQGKPREAEPEHREALRLKPNDPLAHISLGNALAAQGKLAEAMAEYRKALRLRPDEPKAHYNLGTALGAQGKLSEAEAEFREALRLRPDYAAARSNLAVALASQGQLAEAEPYFREAVRLRPDTPEPHSNLGNILQEQGKLAAAEAEFREAIRLRPGFADAHCNLGQTLRLQGRFADSLDAFRRGHELGSKQPNWRHASARLVQQAEQLVALDSKLSGVLQGKARPSAASEQLALADFCQKHKKLYPAAARFYADAFAADPKMADGLHRPHLYNAACAAALAGCGRGEAAAKLDDGERARLRRQALGWLRADLAAYREFLDKNPEQALPAVQQTLRHWQHDADLTGVRGDSLIKLPEIDRQNWQRLWTDVEETLKKASQRVR